MASVSISPSFSWLCITIVLPLFPSQHPLPELVIDPEVDEEVCEVIDEVAEEEVATGEAVCCDD